MSRKLKVGGNQLGGVDVDEIDIERDRIGDFRIPRRIGMAHLADLIDIIDRERCAALRQRIRNQPTARTPAEFGSESIRKKTSLPVRTVPYAISAPTDDACSRSWFHLPENQFLYLTMRGAGKRAHPHSLPGYSPGLWLKYQKSDRYSDIPGSWPGACPDPPAGGCLP